MDDYDDHTIMVTTEVLVIEHEYLHCGSSLTGLPVIFKALSSLCLDNPGIRLLRSVEKNIQQKLLISIFLCMVNNSKY
jgi:hypothetical protein